MSCRGDNYDVDRSAANGCEVLDVIPPGHTNRAPPAAVAKTVRHRQPRFLFGWGAIRRPRTQNPPVAGFGAVVGAAPITGSCAQPAACCVNDVSVTFTTRGGSAIMLPADGQTNKRTDTIDVSGSGSGGIGTGSGAYSGGSDIYFIVERRAARRLLKM